MKKNLKHRMAGPELLDLLEESMMLLRAAPLNILLSYYVGTLPFLLSFIYFWADMAKSAQAEKRLVLSSLVLMVAYAWMKTWQSVFCQLLKDFYSDNQSKWTLARIGRTALLQIPSHVIHMIFYPAALFLVVTIPWYYSLGESLTALGDAGDHSFKKLYRRAITHANLWSKRNVLLFLSLMVVSLLVLLNLVAGVKVGAEFLRALTGIESIFTRTIYSLVNLTFFMGIVSLTYALVDPLSKTLYTLRGFYGDSIHSGTDLLIHLRMTLKRRLAICLVFFGLWMGSLHAASPEAVVSTDPKELGTSIREVIQQRKFQWRLPRIENEEADTELNRAQRPRWVDDFFTGLRQMFRDAGDWLSTSLRNLLRKTTFRTNPGIGIGGGGLAYPMKIMMTGMIISLVLLGLFFLFRAWRRRQQAALKPIEAITESRKIDVMDESILASDFPEDEWLKLARQYASDGNFRLALRAIHLATLVVLDNQRLIQVAKFKSNWDYLVELTRRSRSKPEVPQLFQENVRQFDRSWYGMYDVNAATFSEFQNRFERIKGT